MDNISQMGLCVYTNSIFFFFFANGLIWKWCMMLYHSSLFFCFCFEHFLLNPCHRWKTFCHFHEIQSTNGNTVEHRPLCVSRASWQWCTFLFCLPSKNRNICSLHDLLESDNFNLATDFCLLLLFSLFHIISSCLFLLHKMWDHTKEFSWYHRLDGHYAFWTENVSSENPSDVLCMCSFDVDVICCDQAIMSVCWLVNPEHSSLFQYRWIFLSEHKRPASFFNRDPFNQAAIM